MVEQAGEGKSTVQLTRVSPEATFALNIGHPTRPDVRRFYYIQGVVVFVDDDGRVLLVTAGGADSRALVIDVSTGAILHSVDTESAGWPWVIVANPFRKTAIVGCDRYGIEFSLTTGLKIHQKLEGFIGGFDCDMQIDRDGLWYYCRAGSLLVYDVNSTVERDKPLLVIDEFKTGQISGFSVDEESGAYLLTDSAKHLMTAIQSGGGSTIKSSGKR